MSRQEKAGPRQNPPVNNLPTIDDVRIGIVGLGYVGLPLAVAFAKKFPTIGFDIDSGRIEELKAGRDRTLEVSSEALGQSSLALSSGVEALADCNFFIVTVPTPIDSAKRPDLRPLYQASRTIGGVIRRGSVVVYESTVYPGATEEDCAPLIAAASGLRVNEDFFLGYSPERINPGDKDHTVEKITKVTSGSTPEAADLIDKVYARVIAAGTFKAASIRIAEAAKVIENIQRDVNIALVNELASLFGKLDIDTLSVLEAAGTKWNFLPFRPGLVGGHCIGVDPYYLTHKAQEVGHHPDVILAGRRINDAMGGYVASRLVKCLLHKSGTVRHNRVLIMGFTFKENCPDIRNTRVMDVVSELQEYGISVDVTDPWVDPAQAEKEYKISFVADPSEGVYDAVLIAVAHHEFKDLGIAGIRRFLSAGGTVFDIKGLFPIADTDLRL